jgi:uncharacterized protein DUF3667
VPADIPLGSASEARCRDCGAPAPDAYCPACGQETRERLPTLREFMREAAGRYVALDGKLWKTLGALLFRPGFLTREYLAGRRRRYIRPARLFLVASLLLFAVLRVATDVADIEVIEAAPRETAKSPFERAMPPTGVQLGDDFNVDVGDLQEAVPALKKRVERFNRMPPRERLEQIVSGMLRYGPYAMFVLLPAFAALLKVLYLGRWRRTRSRPRLYGEHLVFAAHNHAFLFLVGVAAVTIRTISQNALPVTLLVIWIAIYMFWSLRAVYGGSWKGIVARSLAMLVTYAVMFAFVTAGLVVTAVVLR